MSTDSGEAQWKSARIFDKDGRCMGKNTPMSLRSILLAARMAENTPMSLRSILPEGRGVKSEKECAAGTTLAALPFPEEAHEPGDLRRQPPAPMLRSGGAPPSPDRRGAIWPWPCGPQQNRGRNRKSFEVAHVVEGVFGFDDEGGRGEFPFESGRGC